MFLKPSTAGGSGVVPVQDMKEEAGVEGSVYRRPKAQPLIRNTVAFQPPKTHQLSQTALNPGPLAESLQRLHARLLGLLVAHLVRRAWVDKFRAKIA